MRYKYYLLEEKILYLRSILSIRFRFLYSKEDGYNIITHEVTCGHCQKTIGSVRALFHFHFIRKNK